MYCYIGEKSIFFACNYRSPDEPENYSQNFQLTLLNIDDTSSIVIGDFNARCRKCWARVVNSNAAKELECLTSTAGYTKLIDKLF